MKQDHIVNVALIGAGGMGMGVVNKLKPFEDVRVIAVADPAAHYQDDFFYKRPVGRDVAVADYTEFYGQRFPGFTCHGYEDFRVMLDQEPDIDACIVATPDHLHAYASVYCMRRGKHVYCEKPLAHSIREVRWMAQVAAETGVKTQMGNLGHARDGMREAIEIIRSGVLGTILEAHAWVPACRWHKGMTAVPTESSPLPDGFNWDLWLGPRPFRPYNDAYHPVRWRDFWTFGLGAIGDFVCHDLDLACWALDLVSPTTVEALQAGKTSPELTPHAEICRYRFARPGQPDLNVTWWDGGLRPQTPSCWPEDRPWPTRGSLFIGTKAIMLSPDLGGKPEVYSDDPDFSFTPPPATLPRSVGHHREWIDAILGGQPAGSEFGYAARLTELALLGVVAIRTGKRFHWNHDAMTAEGVPEADDIINGEPYRDGWQLH